MSGGRTRFQVGRLRTPRLLSFLPAALLAAARLSSAQGLPYSVSIAPEPPRVGEIFSVTVLLPETAPGTIQALEPAKTSGLSLDTISVSAASPAAGEASVAGARVVFTFRALKQGDVRIPVLELRIAGEPFTLGPIAVDVLPSKDAPPQLPYEWSAPSVVRTWQCFSAALKPRSEDAPGVRTSVLPASAGMSLEAFRGLGFVGMAMETGYLSLPTAYTTEGNAAAEPLRLRSVPPPKEISESRAIGTFTARLARPERNTMLAGETLSLRVEVQGRGNLPILHPPDFTILKADAPPIRSQPMIPIFKVRIVAGAYEGTVGTELRFAPEEPGVYRIETEPFVFLNTETGRVETIRFAQVRLTVEPPPDPPGIDADPPPSLLRALEAYAARTGLLGAAATQALSGDGKNALVSLAEESSPEALHLRGILLLRAGKYPQALSVLGAAERRRRFLPGLSETLALCEELAGGGARLQDRLPEPSLFFGLFMALAAAGGALVVAAASRPRRSGGQGSLKRGYYVLGWGLVFAAVLALLFGAAAALERRTRFAVVNTETAFTVPSEAGSSAAGGFMGHSGTVAAVSAGWTLIKFPDGSSAWFRDGAYFAY